MQAWLLAAVMILLASAWPAGAVEPLRLAGERAIPLNQVIAYRHDVHASDGATEAFAHARAGRFSPLPGGSPNFGFQAGAYWFYLPLVNTQRDEPRWLLVQQYALSDQLDLYLRYPDGRVEHHASGDHVPFNSRYIRYRHPNFRLDLPHGQQVELLVRVQSHATRSSCAAMRDFGLMERPTLMWPLLKWQT